MCISIRWKPTAVSMDDFLDVNLCTQTHLTRPHTQYKWINQFRMDRFQFDVIDLRYTDSLDVNTSTERIAI
jgi:hypothetical protein